jgi:hypothetical protein
MQVQYIVEYVESVIVQSSHNVRSPVSVVALDVYWFSRLNHAQAHGLLVWRV